MKIGLFRTCKIAFLSVLFTLNTCGCSVIMRLFGRINRQWVDITLHRWADRILSLVGVTCQVINPYHVTPKLGKPTIIMCNHSSLYDIPISLKAFPNHSIRMLAKKELARIPIMGNGMTAAEFPFIDRKNRHQAMKDLAYTQKLMESGIVIWVAPEGTRSKDGMLANFKKGIFLTAIAANATIIPIGIRGAYHILPARTIQFNLNQLAEIHIGQPIEASHYLPDEKQSLIDTVYHAIKTLSNN
jgi:1-acyl-sn-glycerol-3-phosphate acyltransferase